MKQKNQKIYKKNQKNKLQSPSFLSPSASSSSSSSKKRNKQSITSNNTNTQRKDNNQPKNSSNLSELQQKFQKKLEGARFRSINERLYTCRGDEAFGEFQQNSNLFYLVSSLFLNVFISFFISIMKDIVSK